MMAGARELDPWEHALQEIPKLSVASGSGQLRRALSGLPPFPTRLLDDMDGTQLWRAYSTLSFLAHAYMWCEQDGGPPPGVLPARLAVPWVDVAERCACVRACVRACVCVCVCCLQAWLCRGSMRRHGATPFRPLERERERERQREREGLGRVS
jgi:hypothetical protein